MVSYKKMYENAMSFMPIGLKCPDCGSMLGFKGSEFICENESCQFDKTPDDFRSVLKEKYNLEEFKE